MRWLLFLSRVAFICNLFFIVSAALQYKNLELNQQVVSTILILGYFLAVFIFNPLANLFYFVTLFTRRRLFSIVPSWLVMANFIFLLLQALFIIFFLNDTINN